MRVIDRVVIKKKKNLLIPSCSRPGHSARVCIVTVRVVNTQKINFAGTPHGPNMIQALCISLILCQYGYIT